MPDALYTIDGSNNSSSSEVTRELTVFQHMSGADPGSVNTLVVDYDDPLKPKADDTENEITDEMKEEKC